MTPLTRSLRLDLLAFILCLLFLPAGGCSSSSDPEIQYRMARDYELNGQYKEAMRFYSKAARGSKGKYLYYRARTDLARNYYYLNQLDKAGRTAREVLASLPDTLNPKVSLDARMILLSIERKTSSQQGGTK